MSPGSSIRTKIADAGLRFGRFVRQDTGLVAAVLLIVASLWAFIEIVDEVQENEQEEIDVWVASALRSGDSAAPIGPDWLVLGMLDATALGGAMVLTIVILLTAGFLAILRQYRSMWLIIIASGLGLAISTLLKSVFGRERPDESLHLAEVSSASFPSGHSMLSAVVYLTLGVVLATARPRKRERFYIIVAAFFLTGLVGISRVYIGVHYVTDVLAGWAVGLCWAMLCLLVARWLQRRGSVPSGND